MSNFQLDIAAIDDSHSSFLNQMSRPSQMPQTKNVVSKLDVSCKLDLKDIMTKSRNSEYNPKRFAAVIMRIREPKSTALIFSTGKIVITGAKTPNDSWISARKYVRILQKLEYPAKFSSYSVVNMVACCNCGFPVRLESFAHYKPQYCSYEPELFPGLIYRMLKPKVVVLIFVSGKIVLTGAKSKDDIDHCWKLIWPILLKFKKNISWQANVEENENVIEENEEEMDLDQINESDDEDEDFDVH